MGSVKRPPIVDRVGLSSAQSAIYVPPPSAPIEPIPVAQIAGLAGDDYEARYAEVDYAGAAIVYATKRRWSGIEVSVNPTVGGAVAGLQGGTISARVFGVTGGLSTLVATGRAQLLDDGAGGYAGQLFPWRMVAAMALCERFEVEVSYAKRFVANANPLGKLGVSIIASDHVDPPAPDVGAIWWNAQAASSSVLMAQAGAGRLVAGMELLAVSAINDSVAARWIHVYDTLAPTANTLNGSTPLFAYALPVGAGIHDFAGPRGFRFTKAIYIVPSSTSGTTTNTGDCRINALIR